MYGNTTIEGRKKTQRDRIFRRLDSPLKAKTSTSHSPKYSCSFRSSRMYTNWPGWPRPSLHWKMALCVWNTPCGPTEKWIEALVGDNNYEEKMMI